MRWGSIIVLLVTLALTAGVVQDMDQSVLAQESTPAAGQEPGVLPEGVSARAVASGSIEVLAPSTAFLSLGRVTLDPGAVFTFDPTDPAAVLIYSASGELTFLVEADTPVARRVDAGTPAPAPEPVAANTEFTLSEGDSAFFPPFVAGEVRNNGTEPATAWVVNVAHFTSENATPTP
jgi:hypothetical protein